RDLFLGARPLALGFLAARRPAPNPTKPTAIRTFDSRAEDPSESPDGSSGSLGLTSTEVDAPPTEARARSRMLAPSCCPRSRTESEARSFRAESSTRPVRGSARMRRWVSAGRVDDSAGWLDGL